MREPVTSARLHDLSLDKGGYFGQSGRVLSLRSAQVRAACIGVVLAALALNACGDDGKSGTVVQSSDLECDGERSGTFNPDFDPASLGDATSDIAIDAVVQPFAERHSGQVVVLRSDTKAVEVDGKRVLVVVARPAPAGGFWADSVYYCEPFMDEARSAPTTPGTASVSDPGVVPSFQIASIGEDVDVQEASSAALVALADDRLVDLLRTNPYEVESVQAASSSLGLVVSVRFDAPLGSQALYPLEACAIETNGAPITGLRWLVQGNRIAAVSPVWGDDTACGYRAAAIPASALPGSRVEIVTVSGGKIAVRAVNGSAEPLAQIPK